MTTTFIDTDWITREIDEYTKIFGILVLFDFTNTLLFGQETKILIYGSIDPWDRSVLRDDIGRKFGNHFYSVEEQEKINEFSVRWYRKRVLKIKSRVVNKKIKEI